jgi:hypothetical protein
MQCRHWPGTLLECCCWGLSQVRMLLDETGVGCIMSWLCSLIAMLYGREKIRYACGMLHR